MKNPEEEAIIQFALEDEKNLHLALSVGAAFAPLQRELILRFLGSLQDRLALLGPDWETTRHIVEEGWGTGLELRHKTWEPSVHVGFKSESKSVPLRYVYFWIRGDVPSTVKSALCDKLNQEVGRGNESPKLLWWQYADMRWRHWVGTETLLEVWRQIDLLNDTFKRLSSIAQTAHKVLSIQE